VLQFAGAVLNGGRSSRMGTDKSVIKFNGGRLIDVSLDILIEAGAEQVLIIGGDETVADQSPNVAYLEDLYPNEGPLGGVITALTFSKFEVVAILACDHMYLTADILLQCLSGLDGYEISCPKSNGTKQVLCSMWRRSTLPKLTQSYESGNRSVMNVIQELECKTFEVADTRLLRTANTPEELSDSTIM